MEYYIIECIKMCYTSFRYLHQYTLRRAAMSESKNSSYKGLTEARRRANKKYNDRFVEIKVRVTPEKRSIIQEHAASMGESATAFINRAIDEAMERDKEK